MKFTRVGLLAAIVFFLVAPLYGSDLSISASPLDCHTIYGNVYDDAGQGATYDVYSTSGESWSFYSWGGGNFEDSGLSAGGGYFYYVNVYYDDGSTGYADYGYVYTPTLTISINSPADGSYTNTSPYINASYDNETGGPILIYLDGGQIYVNDYGSSFDYYASGLFEGTHTITVSDQWGNFVNTEWYFISDVTPPVISINSPLDGSYTNAAPYISASYFDNIGGPLLVYLDGGQIAVNDYGTSFDFQASGLLEGTHTITVSDQAGNFSGQEWYFTVDATPPMISINSPQNGSFTDTSVYISASYSDNNAGPMLVYLDGNQIATNDDGSNFDYQASGLTPGIHTITVSDQAGNFATAEWAFTIDWTPAGSLSIVRGDHTATLLPNGKVLAAGGYDWNNDVYLNSAELYDPVSNAWSAAANLSIAREGFTATLLPNGKVLVVGGAYGDWELTASAELYDPVSNTWSSAGSMTVARGSHTATLLVNGKVLVAGGINVHGPQDSAELYDPVTNTWSSAGSLGIERYAHTMTPLANGTVLVTGGYSYASGSLSDSVLYDPASNSWRAAGSLATDRYAHTATLLANGSVLVAGGQNLSSWIIGSAEIYDPVSDTWSDAGSLAIPRAQHDAVLLSSGNVLVTSGYGHSGYQDYAELYAPASNSWSAAGWLAIARDGDTATLLQNGKVLVAGGVSGSGSLNDSELFGPATTPPMVLTVSPNRIVEATSAQGAVVSYAAVTATDIVPIPTFLSCSQSSGSIFPYGATTVNVIGVDATDNTTLASFTVTVRQSSLVFSVQPRDTVVNENILPAVAVSFRDQNGNIETNRNDLVTLSVGANPAGGNLSGNLAVSAVNGVAMFLGLSINTVGNGYTLHASAAGLSGTDSSPFNVLVNPWSSAGNLPSSPYLPTATLLPNGKVLVAGGWNYDSGGPLSSAQLYNPMTNTWSAAGNLATARYMHTATLLPSGKVLIAGGYGSSGLLNSAELYEPVANTWNAAGRLNDGPYIHTAVLLPSGKVLVAGGYNYNYINYYGPLSSAELYDPASNSWSGAGSLATARYYHTATLLPNGKVLIAAGVGYSGMLNSAELYDSASNTWSVAGTLTTARYVCTATLLASGKVLVSGGWSEQGVLSSAEVYDPGSNTWSATGNLTAARYDHSATLLQSGKVLVVGGLGNPGPLDSTELYDPVADTWSTVGSLGTARFDHVATLLQSGKVLVAGGYNYNLGYLNSAELYGSVTAPPMVITPPSNQIVEATSNAGASVSYSSAAATDIVPIPRLFSYSKGTGTTFPVGTTTVNVIGVDATDNTTTASFSVTVRRTSLVFNPQPTNVEAGQGISPAVKVSLVDQNGVLETDSTASVTLAIGNNPAGGTLSGTLTINAVNGVATFPGLRIDQPGTGYTLQASAAGVTGTINSNAFPVVDTTPPVVTPPPNLVVEATSAQGSAVANLGTATATDAVTPHPVIVFNPPAGSTFPLGVTTVTVSATDNAEQCGDRHIYSDCSGYDAASTHTAAPPRVGSDFRPRRICGNIQWSDSHRCRDDKSCHHV